MTIETTEKARATLHLRYGCTRCEEVRLLLESRGIPVNVWYAKLPTLEDSDELPEVYSKFPYLIEHGIKEFLYYDDIREKYEGIRSKPTKKDGMFTRFWKLFG